MEPLLKIQTIFGEPHFAKEMHKTQDRYVWETRDRPLIDVNNLDKRPIKHFKGEKDNITFKDSDAHPIHHPHCNALVITVMMGNNKVHRILVNNGSSIDILYY